MNGISIAGFAIALSQLMRFDAKRASKRVLAGFVHDFLSYLSVRNTAIFCEYNFDSSPPGVEKTAEKPRQAL